MPLFGSLYLISSQTKRRGRSSPPVLDGGNELLMLLFPRDWNWSNLGSKYFLWSREMGNDCLDTWTPCRRVMVPSTLPIRILGPNNIAIHSRPGLSCLLHPPKVLLLLFTWDCWTILSSTYHATIIMRLLQPNLQSIKALGVTISMITRSRVAYLCGHQIACF